MVEIRHRPLQCNGTDHGFVYLHAHFSTDRKSIEMAVRPRKVRPHSARAAIRRRPVATILSALFAFIRVHLQPITPSFIQ